MSVVPVVLITGASRGLGRGIALEAAAQGCSVAINYASNAAAAHETAAMCAAAAASPEQRFVPIKGDIGNRDDRAGLLAHTLDTFGRIDALVNNAGMAPRVRADLTETSEASFEELIRVNLQGPFFLTQAVAKHWLARPYAPALEGGFKILFITSISADTASINRGEYCVSKAGLAMTSQLWAVRLAAEGVQVLELRPGIMATDMTAGVKDKYDALLADGLVPQRRWGTAEDVGRAVRAVLAGAFPFTTGDVIHLDGGFHVRRL
ncbi:3-ketoacyl-ACP reductase [Luteitalea sp. TBR-22]|uniref:3-ketoacyl-ACP reductase n=1 Tax=Luteitalea sp. TBR-22 TaxID=2802971 RepID=UPI001AF89936|nr:3-ketoacyl-ACP reductase [Luteitalea sp. TBR-22]BCS31226.1 3-ketoacyl-ACP reductase [Luteitalea sp. TBR-22]